MITSLLRKIEKPGRYYAPFINMDKRPVDENAPKVLILFPDIFEVAQSHTGVKILYSLFRRGGFTADFGFAVAKDFEKEVLADKNMTSMIHGIDFRDFDLICVSFQYQLQFPNFLRILDMAGIEFRADKRKKTDPIILSGGPAMCNPEPITDFVDAAFIGEIEPSVEAIIKSFSVKTKASRLKKMSVIDGFYFPQTDGKVKLEKDGAVSGQTVKRSLQKDLNLDNDVTFDCPVFAMRTVHDRFTTEIMRGCTRGCRFCMAGMFYRPHRERSAHNVCEMLDRVVRSSGYDEAGFLSLSAADHSEIEDILVESMGRYGRDISISLPSLRTDSLTEKMIDTIKNGRKGGFTLAPESGSEKLRKVINKGNTSEDLLNSVKLIFANQWKHVKLYFMLGLPLEEEEDIYETVELVKKICSIAKGYGRKASVTASFSTFVPQPFTPFQWEKMASADEIKAKQKIIINNLRGLRNLKLNWHNSDVSTIEGYLTRGGREFNAVIESVTRNMTGLQSDDDFFDLKLWHDAMDEEKIERKPLLDERPTDKLMPFEHIDLLIDRRFLLKEREKAYNYEETSDCAFDTCHQCGTCDFKDVKPMVRTGAAEVYDKIEEADTNRGNSTPWLFTFSKKDRAISIGHLDMVSFMLKGFSMSELKILYSEGFHPLPRFSLIYPAPVGLEIEEEHGTIWFTQDYDPEEVLAKLNSVFSGTGIEFHSLIPIEREKIKKLEKSLRTAKFQHYSVIFKDKEDFNTFKEVLTIENLDTKELRIDFEHPTEKGGVMKLFLETKGEFHVIKRKNQLTHKS